MSDEGVRVRMKGRVLFAPGDADLDRAGLRFLDSLVRLLKENKNIRLTVEGHTDDSHFRSAKFPSNWELSTVRAARTLAYLVAEGAPANRMAAAGFAGSRPQFPNNQPETKVLNRRVEFLSKRSDPMNRYATVALLAATLLLGAGACEKEAPPPATDLAMEMGAKKEVEELKALWRAGKSAEALARFAVADKKYGHTKIFAAAKEELKMSPGERDAMERASMTGKALVKLQNLVLSFRRETGSWPAPGQVLRPADGWNHETYWVPGDANSSYDLLIVSPGADGKPGSGDELIIVWTEEDIGGYKDKRTGKMVGKTKKSRKPVGGEKGNDVAEGKTTEVMTIEQLTSMDKEAGFSAEQTVDLGALKSMGDAHAAAGQPRGDDAMVLSISELEQSLK